MSQELDMSQYLELFLQEADEQLEILEQETLKLELDPTSDRLNLIFRAAHTLKGSSRAMGFAKLAEVTHEMENVLDRLRGGHLGVTTEIADALLACLDTLNVMKAGITEGRGDHAEFEHLVSKLQSFSSGAPAIEAKATEVSVSPTVVAPASDSASNAKPESFEPEIWQALGEAASAQPVWRMAMHLTPDCAMKFVRAFMAIQIVEDGGELLASWPNREALEEEQFENTFVLYFNHSSDGEALTARFQTVGEVASFTLEAWDGSTSEAPTESAMDSGGSVQAEADVKANVPAASIPAANAPASAPGNPESGPSPATANPTATKKTESGQTVRVDVARLDELMNLVGELVIDRTRIAQIASSLSGRMAYDENLEALTETVSHVARITSDLQDQIMKARMLPIENVFNRFPRVVRDLAQKIGKDVRLELEGGDTELDRSVIEVIGDPLLHILRNAVDHGLETPADRVQAGKSEQGCVKIAARHQENHIVIEITDDGRGIDIERVKNKAIENGLTTREAADRMSDKEALQYIFASGLSTAKEVSEVSGRGVGMDIVRTNLQKLGGIIDLETELGKGSKFSLRLPLTLAIIRGLLVKVQNVVYVLPLGSVVETLKVLPKAIQRVNKREVIVLRGLTTPLVSLEKVFGSGLGALNSDEAFIVIVGLAEQRVGLVVDELIGEQEVVIKSLSSFCGEVRGVSGATILGDGNVALIADVNGLVAAA